MLTADLVLISAGLHPPPCCLLQVSLWDAPCGGLDSPYRRNASDPAICCPLGSSCIYYNQLYWRCVPQHYTGELLLG